MRIHSSACGYAVSRVVLSLISVENTVAFAHTHTNKTKSKEKEIIDNHFETFICSLILSKYFLPLFAYFPSLFLSQCPFCIIFGHILKVPFRKSIANQSKWKIYPKTKEKLYAIQGSSDEKNIPEQELYFAIYYNLPCINFG